MKYNLFVFLALTFLIIYSCEKEVESKNTRLLTSKTWGQPTVLSIPASIGYWSQTTCPAGEAILFYGNGNYINNNYCLDITTNGKWSWNIADKEIKLETSYNGIKQRTFIVTIVELSDSLLHTREREETEPIENYFEFKYKPRPEK